VKKHQNRQHVPHQHAAAAAAAAASDEKNKERIVYIINRSGSYYSDAAGTSRAFPLYRAFLRPRLRVPPAPHAPL